MVEKPGQKFLSIAPLISSSRGASKRDTAALETELESGVSICLFLQPYSRLTMIQKFNPQLLQNALHFLDRF